MKKEDDEKVDDDEKLQYLLPPSTSTLQINIMRRRKWLAINNRQCLVSNTYLNHVPLVLGFALVPSAMKKRPLCGSMSTLACSAEMALSMFTIFSTMPPASSNYRKYNKNHEFDSYGIYDTLRGYIHVCAYVRQYIDFI